MSRAREVEERLHLARENTALVAVAVGKAAEGGAEVGQLVVLLLDTRDPVARELTKAILERSSDLDLDAEHARVLRHEMIPTAIAIVPARAAELLLGETHPNVAEGLHLVPPHGRVRVVIIAEGGATLLHLPITPLRSIGGA